jgi:malto-oligosyltrehalose trehalohydrolase
MTRDEEGWHQITIADQPFGSSYGFVLGDGRMVPDPASRRQQEVLGPSTLVDPAPYVWKNPGWMGRPWRETVLYELHVGTFTEKGTFQAAEQHLARLAEIGFTAIEVMPLAHLPGERGWGYDGVFQYAPFAPYGGADDFKALVDSAHGLGLMVLLDVVYNHFGPIGNFLPDYAPGFFHADNPTPWGSRIAFEHGPVRRFFIENALYWLSDYHLDGLRVDAVDQILDSSRPHVLAELSAEVRAAFPDREVHLIMENPANATDLMVADANGHRIFEADWNDDFHHAIHSGITNEDKGHFAVHSAAPWARTAEALARGYLSPGRPIISDDPPPPESLPASCYIHFLQNHDQVGNRATGDRIYHGIDHEFHEALVAMLALAPQIPLFFMGDDHLSSRPFRFFADYQGDVRLAVWKNREREAESFGGYPPGLGPDDIPDPSLVSTFLECKLDWAEARREMAEAWRAHLSRLLALRQREVVPLLGPSLRGGHVVPAPDRCLSVDWPFDGGVYRLRANFSRSAAPIGHDLGRMIYPGASGARAELGPCEVRFFIA